MESARPRKNLTGLTDPSRSLDPAVRPRRSWDAEAHPNRSRDAAIDAETIPSRIRNNKIMT